MDFLDHFTDEYQRSLFRGVATSVELEGHEYLLRRGDPGGDLFVVETGRLEVVDDRSVLAVIEAGAVVGELGFLDESPRSADVRAVAEAAVLRWQRDDLRGLLEREPEIAATFYRTLARLASDRLRNANRAVTSLATRDTRPTSGDTRAGEAARTLAETGKEALLDCETRLRVDPTDHSAHVRLVEVLDQLEHDVEELFANTQDADAGDQAARVLCRELHPYLIRSALAERCIRRPQGVVGTAEILAHVLVDTAGGDGHLGELLDRWLLDRPAMRALRTFRSAIVDAAAELLPTNRNRRVLLLNAGTGSLAAGLNHVMADAPTVMTVVDQSRDALAFLDAGFTYRPRNVTLTTFQENLAQFAMGRFRNKIPSQDLIVIHGLLEYMPDRIALSLLSVVRNLLTEDGVVVATTLAPSPDQAMFDRLLDWPTVRRRRESLRRLVQHSELEVLREPELPSPGLLIVGAHPERVAASVAPSG